MKLPSICEWNSLHLRKVHSTIVSNTSKCLHTRVYQGSALVMFAQTPNPGDYLVKQHYHNDMKKAGHECKDTSVFSLVRIKNRSRFSKVSKHFEIPGELGKERSDQG